MLAEAIVEISCDAGVVFAVFIDYVEIPHVISNK